MLKRLYVDNYKCLVNFEFKPERAQLIIGRNGTGKSTVLDVISVLRDFAVRGESCDERLMGKTRTLWQNANEQRFELDVMNDAHLYQYRLTLDEWGQPLRPRVTRESLDFDGKPLFLFEKGKLYLYNDYQSSKAAVDFPFDWHRSGLAKVDARKDNIKLTWFKQWLGRTVPIRINPWAISSRSEIEAREPARDLSNFADWYRHLLLDSGQQVFGALQELGTEVPGLEALDAKEAGMDVRVLQARIRVSSQPPMVLPFGELSEGQRALVALYILMHCAVVEDSTLLIDEPDNFIALAEIQPWLLKILDRAEKRRAQLIFVSHHPELLNQLAGRGGVVFERQNGGPTRVIPFAPQSDTGLTPSEIVARGWENA